MKTLNHRAIFLQTLDGFFAPLVGAFKGAAAEIRRTSAAGQTLRSTTHDHVYVVQRSPSKTGTGPKPNGPSTPSKKRRSKLYCKR